MDRSITIVGASGQMGKWFAKFFLSRGWTVHLFSRTAEKIEILRKELKTVHVKGKISFTIDYHDCIPKSAWIMLSIPVTSHEETIAAVAPLMKKTAVLFDIASVKGTIPAMLQAARSKQGIHVLSTHPMYGPGTESMRNKNFILIDLEGDKKVLNDFKAVIEPEKPTIIETTAQEHDRMIGYTLGIPHMLNILFGKFLKDQNVDIEKLVLFEGTTFHLQHLISQEVVTQEPYIYATIELENQEFIAMLSEFKHTTEKFIEILRNKDYEGFMKEFLAIREHYEHIAEFKSVGQRFNSAARRSLDIIKEGKESKR